MGVAIEMVCSCEFWRMAVWWTLALLFSYFRLLVTRLFPSIRPAPTYPRRRRRRRLSSTNVERPICVITGATSGLGAAAAAALAGEGYYVVLAGRCSELLCKTIQEIQLQNKDARLKAFQVDLSSIRSVVKFESNLREWLLDSKLHPSVQLLINNAGILAASFRVTADGCDQMMETNYIGAFILTNLLLPLLRSSPLPSRIVNVTSFTHQCVCEMKVDSETLAMKSLHCFITAGKYPFARVYEYSKLCLLLFSYELHRRLYVMDPSPNISVMAADPGAVETGIMRELPPCLSQLAFIVLKLFGLLHSPKSGVNSIIDASLAPPEASGKYFFGGKGRTISSSSLSYNAKLAEELWFSSSMLSQEMQQSLGETLKA